MEYILRTKNRQEAESMMNIDKYEAAIEGLRNLILCLSNDRLDQISILYRGKVTPIKKLDRSKITTYDRIIQVDEIINLLEEIVEDIPDNK